MLDRPVPLAVIYRWLAGAKASGLPLDPRPALPGQLFLTGRPLLFGLNDPVPRSLHAFVLPGRRQRVSSINWNEFGAPLAAYAESERRAHVAGAELGWRALLARYLGDGEGRLGFFKPLSIALGYAARSAEPADEIVGVMHAIVSAHPDLNADRAGQYTPHWLRCELLRLRAKDVPGRAVPRNPPPPSPHHEFRPMTTYSRVNTALYAYNTAAAQCGRSEISWRRVAERCGVQPQVFFDHCDAIAQSQKPFLSPDAEALAAAILRDLEEQTAALLSARGNGADPDEEPGAKQEARADGPRSRRER